jgi:hypothetical protein
LTPVNDPSAKPIHKMPADGGGMTDDGPILRFADHSSRATLLVQHAAILDLCLEWERLADALPALPSRRQWARLKSGFAALRDRHLPALDVAMADIAAEEKAAGHLLAFIDRLSAQNLADADHSRDVEAAFDALRSGAQPPDAEALGFMLRCLFDGCRRTVLAREILLSALVVSK